MLTGTAYVVTRYHIQGSPFHACSAAVQYHATMWCRERVVVTTAMVTSACHVRRTALPGHSTRLVTCKHGRVRTFFHRIQHIRCLKCIQYVPCTTPYALQQMANGLREQATHHDAAAPPPSQSPCPPSPPTSSRTVPVGWWDNTVGLVVHCW